MIKVVNLVQHYGIRPVLRDVNLEIARGELVAVMGPNGMGKSTLLRSMAGILSPQKGQIEIDGKVRRRTVDEENSIRRMVFYLPDDPWLPLMRTGREYLLAIGRLYEVEINRLIEHIERLLEVFALAEIGDSMLQSYSTGQKKKIAICGAFVSEAPVMILDEPFSGGLDPAAIAALRHMLERQSRQRSTTIVMATPVPELVDGLAHRLVILKQGTVVAFDTPEGLRRATGCDGPLDQVLEVLLNPEMRGQVERYFEEIKP